MKDKLILTDGSVLQVESGSSLSDIRVVSETGEEMLYRWKLLTNENLKQVEVQNADGVRIVSYNDLTLESETSVIQKDGTILTSLKLRERTEVELLRERVEILENGQEVHSGAISDLGEAVSGLAEEGGLA